MSRKWFRLALLAIFPAVLATSAIAQSLVEEKKSLTPYAARKIIEACLAQAARDHYPIALAVVDPAGYLLSYQATDGATGNTGITAQQKAKTAAIFRRSTAELYERANKQVNRAPEWMGYFPVPGGYPIIVQGEVVGAIGAGAAGLSAGRDENCAQDAIKTVMGDGRSAPPPSAQPLLTNSKLITADGARKLVDACLAFADRNKFGPLGISVADSNGTLLSFQGTRGASKTILETAELKAVTAAHWRRTTEELWDRVNKQVNRAPEWLHDFPQPGGFPIFVGNDMIGAIGAGGVGDQDDRCAQAAIKAVFPDATTGAVIESGRKQ
jgi:glc operon protein GlcG